jgi:hypothetical protein
MVLAFRNVRLAAHLFNAGGDVGNLSAGCASAHHDDDIGFAC